MIWSIFEISDRILSAVYVVYIRFNRVFTESHFRFLRQEEERKEMFYLMMHSTHFIYGYMVSDTWLRTLRYWKEGNVLFNDTLNTFYLMVIWYQTHGKGPLSYWERKPSVNIPWTTFLLAAWNLLYNHSTERIEHSLCYTSCGALAGLNKTSMGVPRGIRWLTTPWADSLYHWAKLCSCF